MNNFKTIALQKIKEKCDKENYTFNGFVGGEYINAHTKLYLKCNNCGYEWDSTNYDNFIRQTKCPKCARLKSIKDKEDVLLQIKKRCEDENILFNGFVDGVYKNNLSKLSLRCNKCEHDWETTYKNLVLSKTSCPICKSSKLEKDVEVLLKSNNIEYIREYSPPFLGKQSIDFYLPQYHIAIECQGKQHFQPVNFGDNNDKIVQTKFKRQIELDEIKHRKCTENNIKMLYFSNKKYVCNYDLIIDENVLIQKITEK